MLSVILQRGFAFHLLMLGLNCAGDAEWLYIYTTYLLRVNVTHHKGSTNICNMNAKCTAFVYR